MVDRYSNNKAHIQSLIKLTCQSPILPAPLLQARQGSYVSGNQLLSWVFLPGQPHQLLAQPAPEQEEASDLHPPLKASSAVQRKKNLS
jgi:hypothetical protein